MTSTTKVEKSNRAGVLDERELLVYDAIINATADAFIQRSLTNIRRTMKYISAIPTGNIPTKPN